jgi:hypothetical protein
MMDFEYGKIVDLKEDERGYISITINQNIAFKKISKKFNVWDVEYLKKSMGPALRIDSTVRFRSVKSGRYYKLKAIEESTYSECFGCGGYTPERSNQQLECEHCIHSMVRERVDKELKVVKKVIKEYKFSAGATLSLVEEAEESLIKTLYVITVFENTPLYKKACSLDVGSKQRFRGWQKESDSPLVTLFESTDIDEL